MMKMFHEIVQPSKVSLPGNSIKKSLQYGEAPPIDIMVREVIQNSRDAIRDDKDTLLMEFNTGIFKSSKLSGYLSGVTEALESKYGNSEQNYIEFRDRNTYGLDGMLETKERKEYGRLRKLVYSFGEKQREEGKGGSWGYGKTVFFNLGIGLVIYYSKTRTETGQAQERLACILVEDTDYEDHMVCPNAQLGVSFWGEESTAYPGESIPITDPKSIRDFLDIFGVLPFREEEMGTAIIVPFVDLDDLHRKSVQSSFEDVSECPKIISDFNKYLKISIQRWYFPILDNEGFEGTKLKLTINGSPLYKNDMLFTFKQLQRLYNSLESGDNDDFRTDEVRLKDLDDISFETVGRDGIGKYGWFETTDNNLQIPGDADLYTILGIKKDQDSYPPIVFYSRKTGMITEYAVKGRWVYGIPKQTIGNYIIVGFKLSPTASIVRKNGTHLIDVDEYVRKGEKSSHLEWLDSNLQEINPEFPSVFPCIVEKLTRNVSHGVSKWFVSDDMKRTGRKTALGLELGRKVLFPSGYGNKSLGISTPSGGEGGENSSAKKFVKQIMMPSITLDKETLKRSGKSISFESDIILTEEINCTCLELKPIIEEIGSIEEWEEKCGIRFPGSLISFEIISSKINSSLKTLTIDKHNNHLNVRDIEFEILVTRKYMTPYGLKMTKKSGTEEIRVKITYERGKSTFDLNFELSEVKNNG